MTPFTSLFSFKGRVSRRAYFLTVATFFIATAVYVVSTSFVIYAVLHLKEPAARQVGNYLLIGWVIVTLTPLLAITVKRLRDQGINGAWLLAYFFLITMAVQLDTQKLDVYAKIWDNVGVIYIGLLHGIIPFQALNWVTKEVFLGFKGTIALSGLAVAYFWFLFVRRGTVSQGAREQASLHEGAPQKIYAPRGSRRVKWVGASVAAALVLVGAGLVIWQSRGVNVSSAGVKQSTVPVFPEQLALRSCQASGRGHLETIELCTQAINSSKLLEREVAAALVSRANHYIQTKQHDKAIADLNRAIDKKSELPRDRQDFAFDLRARAHLANGRKELAIADLRAAYTLMPSDWYANRLRELGAEPPQIAPETAPQPKLPSAPPTSKGPVGGNPCGLIAGGLC